MARWGSLRFAMLASIAPMAMPCAQSAATGEGVDAAAALEASVAADGAEEGDSNEDAPDPYACPTMAYPLRVRCAPDGGECSGPCDGCECGQSCTCYGGYWGCTPRCCTTSCAFDSGEDR